MKDTSSSGQTRRRFLEKGIALAAATVALGVAKGEGAEKPVAALEKVSPVEELMREHGVLNRILIIYDEAIGRLAAGKDVPPRAVGAAAKSCANTWKGITRRWSRIFSSRDSRMRTR